MRMTLYPSERTPMINDEDYFDIEFSCDKPFDEILLDIRIYLQSYIFMEKL